MIEEVMFHLKNNIKTKIGVSPIDGVGVVAIKDIQELECVFPVWIHKSGIYAIPNHRLSEIPKEVLDLMNMYFTNEDCGYKGIRLFEGLNFLFNPLSYSNSSWPNSLDTNVDSNGFATKNIKAGDEILLWYDYRRNQ